MRTTHHTPSTREWKPWETSCKDHSEAGGSNFRFSVITWDYVTKIRKLAAKDSAVTTAGFAGHTVRCSRLAASGKAVTLPRGDTWRWHAGIPEIKHLHMDAFQGRPEGDHWQHVTVDQEWPFHPLWVSSFPKLTKKILGFCPMPFS